MAVVFFKNILCYGTASSSCRVVNFKVSNNTAGTTKGTSSYRIVYCDDDTRPTSEQEMNMACQDKQYYILYVYFTNVISNVYLLSEMAI